MGLGIARHARSKKAKAGLRALLGRAPEAREVGERLGRIARRMLGDAVTDASPKRLTLALHPAAPPVRISVLPDGDLEVRADTGAIGPGYHADVIARLTPILDELDFVWAEPVDADLQGAHAVWLADQLRDGTARIGMPAALTFKLDAAVVTAMGPRDAAWRDAVLADPRRGADAFAWWDTGPGQRERSQALLAMWLEVPWREPIDRDERALMQRVDAELVAARAAAPSLVLPWAEWAELLDLLGEDVARIAELRERAGGAAPAIGYRRHVMEVEIEGWTLDLPGAFVGSIEEDRYWATDGDRLIELTTLSTDGTQTSAELLAIAPEQHPVIERLVDAQRCGRAEAYDDGDVHLVHGLMASTPDVAILTCKGAGADEPWALATWRSLRRRRG